MGVSSYVELKDPHHTLWEKNKIKNNPKIILIKYNFKLKKKLKKYLYIILKKG